MPSSPISYFRIGKYKSRLLVFISLLSAIAFSGIASAAPLLRCQVEQNGITQLLEFAPHTDPYGVKAVEISREFSFKAVVIGDQRKIDYVKIYAYYQSGRQAVLLHEATYTLPAPLAQSAPASMNTLTGKNNLYSPNLGRELQYGCALIDRAESAKNTGSGS